MNQNTTLFKKTLSYTLLILGSIVIIIHALLYFALPPFYEYQKKQALTTIGENVAQSINHLNQDDMHRVLSSYATEKPYTFILKNNETIYYYKDYSYYYIKPSEDISQAKLNIHDELLNEVENHPNQLSTTVDNIAIDSSIYSLQVLTDIQPINEASSITTQLFPITITISFIISIISAFIYSSKLSKPIKNMQLITKNMESLEPNLQISINTHDEIEELGDSINHLYNHLLTTIHSLENEIAITKQVEIDKINFVRSVSHELKTPLTSLSILLENMTLGIGKYTNYPVYLEKCQEQVYQLSNLINTLLEENTQKHKNNSEFYINVLLEQTIQKYEIIQKSQKITLQSDLASIKVQSDEIAFEKIFSNLINNAFMYTTGDKIIKIRLDQDTVSIFNTCYPISKYETEKVFAPFYRLNNNNNSIQEGSGVGLSIVAHLLTSLNLSYKFIPQESGMEFIININSIVIQ